MAISSSIAYIIFLYYEEGVDVNKSNKSKECMCNHCYFSSKGYRYESAVCSTSLDVLLTTFGLENIAKLKGADYRCIIWNMGISDAINSQNNFKLGDKDPLEIIAYRIWTLVQIKTC